ncbi:MAG: ABC transporter substrate-binding protein [Burkholderiales bacterium]
MNKFSRLLAMMTLTATAALAQPAPDELVMTTAQEVMQIIKADKSVANDKNKLYQLVDAKVLPHFDFNRMTQLAMGRNWKVATDEQKQTLVKEFRQLLVRTYSTSLSQYKNQTIDFKPTKVADSDTETMVKTLVNQPGGSPVPIDYSMQKSGAGWKVYDVTVEGVSLVTNYRGEFNEQIRSAGVDGLIKTLADKNRASEAGK